MHKLKITEMNRLTAEEFKLADKLPLIVVLDNVRSIYNVGSVFRTCDAFRIQCLCLCGITACPPHIEIHKTALGAEETVEWKHFSSTMDCIKWLKEQNYTVLSIEQCEGSTKLHEMQVNRSAKYAIVMGNEVKGVQQEVVDNSDGCIEIVQYGTKHSMNVAVTTGMIIWEMVKQMMY